MPFKMHKLLFFSRKKYVCSPYLKFSDLLPETHLFFNLAQVNFWGGGGGSVVECLTPDRRATGSSLPGVTTL